MRHFFCIAALTFGLGTTGCANLPDSGRRAEALIDRAGVDVIAADGTRQITYFKDRGSNERFCRGPGADALVTGSSAIELGLPTRAAGVGEIGSSASRGGLDLGGRSPAVLIARELLYRACELASNINADPATERLIYRQFLDAIVTISKTQSGPGSAGLAADVTAAALPAAVPNTLPAATSPPTTDSPLTPAATTPSTATASP